MDREHVHAWHVAINKFTDGVKPGDWPSWMYEAKDASQEAERLALLFAMEREGRLPKTHRQCSRQPIEELPQNELSCCLGVKCAECQFLKAIEAADMPAEARDEAKAWTCVGHILSSGGDRAKEGYVLTTSDRIYWDRVYGSLAAAEEGT